MVVLGCVGLGVLYAKRGPVFAGAGCWLRDHQLLTDRDVVATIPHLGGLDLSRILVLAGLFVIMVVTAGLVIRRRSAVNG